MAAGDERTHLPEIEATDDDDGAHANLDEANIIFVEFMPSTDANQKSARILNNKLLTYLHSMCSPSEARR